MSALKAVVITGVGGVVVPLLVQSAWAFLDLSGMNSSPKPGYFLSVGSLMIWPSGFIMAVAPNHWGIEYAFFLTVAIAINVLIYGTLGFAIWFSFNKAVPLLGVLAVFVLAYWIFVLTI